MVALSCAAAPFQFEPTGSLAVGRDRHTATLLNNGKVLVTVGASGGKTAELYHPASGIWTTTSEPAHSRYDHTATLLTNG